MDVRQVREELAAMEGYFHGQSSGMDPLVSLMRSPVLRESGNYYVLSNHILPADLVVFLIDSRSNRATGKLVEAYLNKCDDPVYTRECILPLVQSVDHAISFMLELQMPLLWENSQLISQIQFKYFGEICLQNFQCFKMEIRIFVIIQCA